MHNTSKSALKKIFKSKLCSSILEIGSGLQSTVFIYNKLKQLDNWKFASIEHNDEWFFKVKASIDPNNNFSILKSNLILNNNKFVYDFVTNEKFDLVFIDGPSKLNESQLSVLSDILKKENSILKPTNRNGMQSLHILDWVSQFSHNNTIFILDGRLNSLIYYMENYKQFDYYHVGTKYDASIIHSAIYNKKYNDLTSTTVILNKNSTMQKIIKNIFNYD